MVVAQPDEQTVDIPAPGACGSPGYGGHQGFLPEHSSSPSVEQIIDTPVPGRGVSGGLQDFLPDHRVYFWNRLERTTHWEIPPGRRPG